MMRFLIDDSGAVTVDWVVLTAAVVGLVLASMFTVRDSVWGLTVSLVQTINPPVDP